MPKSYKNVEAQYNKAVKDLAEAVVAMALDETETQFVSLDETVQEFLHSAYGDLADAAQEEKKRNLQ